MAVEYMVATVPRMSPVHPGEGRREEEYRCTNTIYGIDIILESYDNQKILRFA